MNTRAPIAGGMLLALATLLAPGCASTGEDEPFDSFDFADERVKGGGADDEGPAAPGEVSPDGGSDGEAGRENESGVGDDDGPGGDGEDRPDDPEDPDDPDDPGPTTCTYASPNTCAMPREMLAVAGDRGSETSQISGDTSEYIMVRVDEVELAGNNALSMTATLDSPPGMEWDMNVYAGYWSRPDCTGASDPVHGADTAYNDAWADYFTDSNDGKWYVFEIVHVSGGLCGAAAEWTLTVNGNTGVFI